MSHRNACRNQVLRIVGVSLVLTATLATTASADREIKELRRATAPFHSLDVAMASGWDTQLTDCWEDPSGGMGYHYGNIGLIDGEVDPLRPEAILYEPKRNGSLRFVAVEYLVPEEAWEDPEPPMLFGQDFHSNGAGLWILHVWVWRNNPSGIFADWNPRVSCEFAND